eukprot:CAMPEP_0113714026 /NCGR_PEP_ID=MMETSP0038_2-20120614/32352_1 /TAXON_ID=2898 /ORGANISM="Cryptomonas paramecium" /LENGTH=104 /DNA_ID=CAMNT_0000640885 /DNA_START=410 /DNA_END=721 /DNA_ORIENTATION=+ /assembly_acc=CAM_ASM_000170
MGGDEEALRSCSDAEEAAEAPSRSESASVKAETPTVDGDGDDQGDEDVASVGNNLSSNPVDLVGYCVRCISSFLRAQVKSAEARRKKGKASQVGQSASEPVDFQ